ncbi:MAG: DUF1579 domain-containing protein [Rhizomicrobium sp.]|jgi:hypothetical protein
MNDRDQKSPAHDFDFFFGSWRVHHRRLKERLAQCDHWEEFAGSTTAQPLLGGLGNVDDTTLELPGGTYRAATLRAFDPETQKWAIWWLDGRNPHRLEAPMLGGFADGVGTFLADDSFEGRPIKVRFLWSRITPRSCRWEQAFSADEGRSWETNWVMDCTRTG